MPNRKKYSKDFRKTKKNPLIELTDDKGRKINSEQALKNK